MPEWENDQEEQRAALLMGVVGVVRNIRSETMIHPSATIETVIICHDSQKVGVMEEETSTICGLTRTAKLTVLTTGERPKGAAAGLYEDIELYVPMKGLVDVEKETARLKKDRDKTLNELKRVEGKLANEKFLAKAPDEVINKEKSKRENLTITLQKVEESLGRLAELD